MRTSQLNTVLVGILVAVARARAEQENGDAATGARIVVSIPDRKLAVVEDGRVVRVFDTAVGAPVSPSPVGTFRIVMRLENPTWYSKGKVVGPGKANPIGTRWIGLSMKGYGIHGTNVPRSIGRAASHGCIRLRNQDVEELFDMVEVGQVVELHGERDEVVQQLFGAEPTLLAVNRVAQ